MRDDAIIQQDDITPQYPEFEYIEDSEFWKSSLLASRSVVRSLHSESSVGLWREGARLFVSVHRLFKILSLSLPFSLSFSLSLPLPLSLPLSSPLSLFLLLPYVVWTSNIKWLLIVDREFFLFLSRKHPGNFVPTDHPDR